MLEFSRWIGGVLLTSCAPARDREVRGLVGEVEGVVREWLRESVPCAYGGHGVRNYSPVGDEREREGRRVRFQEVAVERGIYDRLEVDEEEFGEDEQEWQWVVSVIRRWWKFMCAMCEVSSPFTFHS